MPKRSAELPSTSADELKKPKTRLVLPDGCMVNIQAKTVNDGHKSAYEVLAQRIADRVDAKWSQLIWNTKEEEPVPTKKPPTNVKWVENADVLGTKPNPSTGRQNDLHSMSTDQLREIRANIEDEWKRLLAENRRIQVYAKEKLNLNLDDL